MTRQHCEKEWDLWEYHYRKDKALPIGFKLTYPGLMAEKYDDTGLLLKKLAELVDKKTKSTFIFIQYIQVKRKTIKSNYKHHINTISRFWRFKIYSL